MMYRVQLVILVVVQVTWVAGASLGTECTADDECETQYSRCHQGFCACLPYYAQHEARCLQSVLLGFDCLVDEQCSQKVANSSCIAGVCQCESGFLQFRRHTCLSPARLGEVCYSDTHCRLWENGSHCDFLIPKLFGRCICTHPLRQSTGGSCLPAVFYASRPARPHRTPAPNTTPSFASFVQNRLTNTEITTDTTITETKLFGQQTTKVKPETTWRTPTTQYMAKRPNTKPASLNSIMTPSIKKNKPTTISPGRKNAPPRPLRTPPPALKYQGNTTKRPIRKPSRTTSPPGIMYTNPVLTTGAITSAALRRGEEKSFAVSLGLPCFSDRQCRAADPNARCVKGVCDCAVHNNVTQSCSAQQRGCHSGTFQCKATGLCISWFFVCDGRADCPDGSDETSCRNTSECPESAFLCSKSVGRGCVSAAARCDGNQDCSMGEDEEGCKNGTENGCPPGTFRCASGTCIPDFEFCNAVITCPDGSDEPDSACKAPPTKPDNEIDYCPFRCSNGRCRSSAVTCSGRDGCGDGSDEERCTVCRCPSV